MSRRFYFPKPKKCKQTGKTMFKKQSQAQYAMGRVISHNPQVDMFDLHTYVCPACGSWHFGHKSYYEKMLNKKSDTVSIGAS